MNNNNEKTPSQRLRAVLWVLYQQKQAKVDFDKWYDEKVEQIIAQVKEKLEPEQNEQQ